MQVSAIPCWVAERCGELVLCAARVGWSWGGWVGERRWRWWCVRDVSGVPTGCGAGGVGVGLAVDIA